MYLLTAAQPSVYGRAMALPSAPARTHLAPASAGRVRLPVGAVAPSIATTITTTTGTGTRSGWVSVRE